MFLGNIILVIVSCYVSQVHGLSDRIAPRITRGPGVEEASVGEVVKFYCSVRGDPMPTITWSHNNNPIYSGSNFTRLEDGNILRVQVSSKTFQGQYCCHADNGHRITPQSCGALHIKHAPHATISPLILEIKQGATTTLHCTLTGRPTPTLYWYHNNQSLPCHKKTGFVLTANKLCRNIEFSGMDLIIRQISIEDTGTYQCVGWNLLGKGFSPTAHLILAKPIKAKPDTGRIKVTTTTTINEIPQDKVGSNVLLWVMGFMLAIVVVSIFACVIYFACKMGFFKRCRRQRNIITQASSSTHEFEMFRNGLTNHMDFPCVVQSTVHTLEYPWYKLKFLKEIGEGVFGKVYEARAFGLFEHEDEISVAVKSLQTVSLTSRSDMLREAVSLHKFRHPNIVQLLGVCFEECQHYRELVDQYGYIGPEPPFLLFEFVDGGDLCAYLRAHGPYKQIFKKQNWHGKQPTPPPTNTMDEQNLSSIDRLNMTLQISSGMEYLAEQQFVHRDLATRNCLYSPATSTVKIADFGLSRNMYSSDYYRAGDVESVPVRWMAPESIMYGKYSSNSDIWAFGVTMWEIYTNAIQPYFGLTNQQVIHTVVQVPNT
uniref:muscle, skeletal receptor tyrosine protein kinase-like isoform X2 n=1 Tax=Ciona intestinalis TaxID=7719 RepID=UPI000EF467F9|nr:muscle, skeletal receptor tyrosine protein kinase-like isoform X2 [Ciona intestinalis]|eukprot:XP_026691195.1 muscle, skeletal receptor tyrosine protein kinase-like isoform X2 [Ciona intestinalis]